MYDNKAITLADNCTVTNKFTVELEDIDAASCTLNDNTIYIKGDFEKEYNSNNWLGGTTNIIINGTWHFNLKNCPI